MIKIEHVRIEEFRGIRELDLDLNGRSFVIHGPNGSGKSGIVDAIDFALTGSIRRLSGEGTGPVSVTSHAPHVHSRDTPSNALVRLTVTDVGSGQTAVLTRSVADPGRYTLTPDSPQLRTAVEKAGNHPEFTLTRRELINLVVSTAAKRSEGIQDLLQLDRLGGFRKRLRTAQTRADENRTAAQTNATNFERSLATHTGAFTLDEAGLLAAVNERRAVLGATAFTALNRHIDFLEGVNVERGQTGVTIATAVAETDTLVGRINDMQALDEIREAIVSAISRLDDTPGLREAVSRSGLLAAGLAAVSTRDCPLCGVSWSDVNALRGHIQSEIDRSIEAQTMLSEVSAVATSFRSELAVLKQSVDQVVAPARMHGVTGLAGKLEAWSASISEHAGLLGSEATAIAAADLFSVPKYGAPEGMTEGLELLSAALRSAPDQSASIAARDFLSIAKERWGNVVTSRDALAAASLEAETAAKVYEAFASASDEALEALYQAVERDFSRFYRKINSDDEGSFRAQFTPSKASLDLAVDFYGVNMFPPNAYHSEGHQDGMGVCLYLALMKQVLADDFLLSILDDVVMSVDVGHRRQFCELLKDEFPNVQFVITTHDAVWARQMQSAGLITAKQQARFFGWSVEGGPLYERGDLWARIEDDLNREDVHGAAHKLRRRLEAATGDIAEAIGGSVPYRGDGNYPLSDFLSAVKGRHSQLLKMAARAANSWHHNAAMAAVLSRKDQRAQVVPDQEAEAWAINRLVHNTDWAQMSVSDLRPVLDSVREFLGLFVCENDSCGGWIHVEGQPVESLRCDCGQYFLNLKPKRSS